MNIKQRRFIENYFDSTSLSDTCKKTNISYPTALKWLKNGEVKNEIENRQKAISKKNLQDSEKLFELSKKELIKIIQSENTKIDVKVQAINTALNVVFKSKEFLDVESGIEILKENKD